MTKFIKLTNMILNTNNIYKILKYPKKYHIYFTDNKFNGFIWLFGGTGVGSMSPTSINDIIEVCETNHSVDYKIVSEWIDKKTN